MSTSSSKGEVLPHSRFLHDVTSEIMKAKIEMDKDFRLPEKYSVIPLLTGGLSLLASYVILREVIVDHQLNKGNAITRLLMSLTVSGMLFSLGTLMSTFASPAGLEYLRWNIGSTTTCDLQGFLLTLGFTASPMFTLALSYFYLFLIRYEYPIALFRVECAVHTFIWLATLCLSVAPLMMGMYNNNLETCWITESPYNCANLDSNTDCTRGHGASDYAYSLIFIPLWPCMTMCIAAVGCLYWTVLRRQKSASAKYSCNLLSVEGFEVEQLSVEDDEDDDDLRGIMNELSKSLAVQATLYVFAFLLTNGSRLAVTLLDMFVGTWHQPSQFFSFVVCMPLQGFLNCWIFAREREMKTMEGCLFSLIFCCRQEDREGVKALITGASEKKQSRGGPIVCVEPSRFFEAGEDGLEKLNTWSY